MFIIDKLFKFYIIINNIYIINSFKKNTYKFYIDLCHNIKICIIYFKYSFQYMIGKVIIF